MSDLKNENIFDIILNYKYLYEKQYVKEIKKSVLFIKVPNIRNTSGNSVIKKKGVILQTGSSLGIVIGTSTSRIF